MGDGLLGHEQAAGDLRVAQALGHEREHLDLARGEPGGIGAGRRARAAPHVARAALAQRPRHACGGGAGAETPGARRGRGAGRTRTRPPRVRAPPRRRIRSSSTRPRRRRRCEPVRLRDALGVDRVGDPGATAPGVQLARQPRVALGERSAAAVSASIGVVRAREPVRLGARGGHGRDALRLAGAARELERLVERLERRRVAAARTQAADHDQRRDPRRHGGAGVGEYGHGGVRGGVPVALLEREPRAVAAHVQQPRVEVALRAVVDSGIEVALGRRQVADVEQAGPKVRVRARDVFLEARLERQLEALQQQRAAVWPCC